MAGPLVVVPGGFVPDRVRHRVRPIAEVGHSLGQRQRGTPLCVAVSPTLTSLSEAGFYVVPPSTPRRTGSAAALRMRSRQHPTAPP